MACNRYSFFTIITLIVFSSLFPHHVSAQTTPTYISECSGLNNSVSRYYCYLFNRLDQAIGNKYQKETEEQGLLSWGYAYVMNGYSEMYLATKNIYYLDKLMVANDSVLSNRDDKRNVTDYLNTTNPCWRNYRYTTGTPYCFVVHSGILIYPLLQFADIVKENPSLPDIYHQKAKLYIDEAEKVATYHDRQWRDSNNAIGYYFDSNAPLDPTTLSSPMPANQQLAMGTSLIKLYKLTHKSIYLDRVTKLANQFRSSLMPSNGGYRWNYGYTPNFASIEDISHGGIDVDFMIQAYANDIVFSIDDLQAVSKTLAEVILKNGTPSWYIDGTGERKIDNIVYLEKWIDLGVYDQSIYNKLKAIYDQSQQLYSDNPYILALLASSKLTKLSNIHEPKIPHPCQQLADILSSRAPLKLYLDTYNWGGLREVWFKDSANTNYYLYPSTQSYIVREWSSTNVSLSSNGSNPNNDPVVTSLNDSYCYNYLAAEPKFLPLPNHVSSPKPGDLNGDGSVDLLDFNKLIKLFGNPYTLLDFNAIIRHYGS